MNSLVFVIRRLVFAIFVLLGDALIVFILAHSIGGNPLAAWLGRGASFHPELAALYAQKYHINDPIWIQFYYYIENLLLGDLGFSPSRGFTPVTTVIQQTLPYTIQLVLFAMVFSMVMGVLLGVIAARYHQRAVDKGIRAFYVAGYSSAPFFVALLLLVLFSFTFHLFPSGGAADPNISNPSPITYLPILDAALEGNYLYFFSAVQHVILPSLSLALVNFGLVVRILRASLLDVMQTNFIRAVRAKGVSERAVFFKHGLRNAMVSVITTSSLLVTWLVTGTIFAENIFAYPGIGQYSVSALSAQDYPGILGATLVFALIIVSTNLIADFSYMVADPQIRLG